MNYINIFTLLTLTALFGCGGGSGGNNEGGGEIEIPTRTTSTEYLLHEAGWNGEEYQIRSEGGIPIVGVSTNTDFKRWAIEETLGSRNLYFFKTGTGNTIRHFKYNINSESYVYTRDYLITGVPSDAKFGKFGASRGTQLYIQSKTVSGLFYFFTYNGSEERYEYDSTTRFIVGPSPGDTDLDRWGVTTDALGYTYLYTFKKGSNNKVFEFINSNLFNPETLIYSDEQTITGIPATADFSDFGTSGVVFAMNFIETKTTEIICGREGERACKIFERIPSCDAGLVEDFTTQKCVKE